MQMAIVDALDARWTLGYLINGDSKRLKWRWSIKQINTAILND